MSLLNHRYRILQALAEGGFGKTFLAEDTQMPSLRRCVIKQLKPMSDRPEVFALVQQRFAREAAVLEAVSKGIEQIPDLYAYFSDQGQFYLVQEWIEGAPLPDSFRKTGAKIASSHCSQMRSRRSSIFTARILSTAISSQTISSCVAAISSPA